jgi:hypothetical protein
VIVGVADAVADWSPSIAVLQLVVTWVFEEISKAVPSPIDCRLIAPPG